MRLAGCASSWHMLRPLESLEAHITFDKLNVGPRNAGAESHHNAHLINPGTEFRHTQTTTQQPLNKRLLHVGIKRICTQGAPEL